MYPLESLTSQYVPATHKLLSMILLEDSSLNNAEDSTDHLLGLHVAKLVCGESHTEQPEQKLGDWRDWLYPQSGDSPQFFVCHAGGSVY